MANSEPTEQAISGLDLHLELAPGVGVRSGLEQALREAIRSGRLPRATRLPATRSLARDLGLSRSTVLAAYTQLAAEGWIQGVQGSGTTVIAHPGLAQEPAAEERAPSWRHDLRTTIPDASSFPRAEWLRGLRRALATAPDELLGYTDPRGIEAVRVELARYLGRARGLQVAPANLVVTTGYTQSLNLLARVVSPCTVAMEEPSMPIQRAIVRDAGNRLALLPVDADGADVSDLGDARLVVLTPNRQHLLGVTLGAARRSQLLDWARTTEGLVVENDYDGEFRYDRRPLSAVQALEPSRVVYAGTASKSLAVGVRLGWLAVPEPLVEPLTAAKQQADIQTSALEQLAFAELLRSGGYDRHIRKQRLRYRRRRDALLAALPATLPTWGTTAGLNLIVPLPDEATEREALAAAEAHGITLYGLTSGSYYEEEPQAGLIVGYAAAPEHDFPQAVAALVAALEACGIAKPGRRGRSRTAATEAA